LPGEKIEGGSCQENMKRKPIKKSCMAKMEQQISHGDSMQFAGYPDLIELQGRNNLNRTRY